MATEKNTVFVVSVFITLSCLIAVTTAVHLKLSDHYWVDYYLYDNDTQIEFQIQAIGVSGFVGIGVNDKAASMEGADLFIGGISVLDFSEYGWDMHVPMGAVDEYPVNDTRQNWVKASVRLDNWTTLLTVRRPLISPDKTHDIDILNKPINLLWAFHPNQDYLYFWQYRQNGSRLVNLMEGSGGGVPTTTTQRTSTSGAVNVGLPAFTLIILTTRFLL